MHRCLACFTDFVGPGWTCPRCAHTPVFEGDVTSFAPALATASEGFNADAHHVLDQVQQRSFWFHCRNDLLLDLTRRWFSQAKTVLEIGCGTGYVLAGLRQALPLARFAGSEISTVGLKYAAQRLGAEVSLFQMDAHAIPFSGEFDLIAACDVLEHLDDDVKALSEIHRALKPGGGVLLTVPQHPLLWSQTDVLAYHKRRYRRNELTGKCRETGFDVVVDTSFVVSLLPLMMAQRLVRGQKKDYDFKSELSLPGWLDRMLFVILDAERRCIKVGARFPVGGSRVVVALKR
jgi:SAM-dependent methyltransferase